LLLEQTIDEVVAVAAFSLQNLPLESRAIRATETRLTDTRKEEAGEGDRRRKAGQSVY
jgi:hypothetical protein